MLRERCKCIIGRVRERGKTMHLIIEARGVYIDQSSSQRHRKVVKVCLVSIITINNGAVTISKQYNCNPLIVGWAILQYYNRMEPLRQQSPKANSDMREGKRA